MGGIVVDWEEGRAAGAFDVLLSSDRRTWHAAYRATKSAGARSSVYLAGASARYVKLELRKPAAGKGFGISRIGLLGPESGFSVNEFFRGIAASAPRGYYPAYLDGEQSYWTIVGAPGDSRKALVNEQGMIEPDKLSFSLEPFLYSGGRLFTWTDGRLSQSLEGGYLPVPSVRRAMDDSLSLTTTAFAAGDPGESSLVVGYTVRNGSLRRQEGALFVAVRPFQVNPPWQTFTIVGGSARVDSITYEGALRVNAMTVLPLTPPADFGAAEFDEGDITDYISRPRSPGALCARSFRVCIRGAPV